MRMRTIVHVSPVITHPLFQVGEPLVNVPFQNSTSRCCRLRPMLAAAGSICGRDWCWLRYTMRETCACRQHAMSLTGVGVTRDVTVKAAELLVKCLEHEGVRHIFGVPGEETM